MASEASEAVAGLPARVRGLMPQLVEDLVGLVEIPSVWQADGSLTEVLPAGEAVGSLLKDAGIGDAHLLPLGGREAPHAPPGFAGHPPPHAPPEPPTLVLYPHLHVRPPRAYSP